MQPLKFTLAPLSNQKVPAELHPTLTVDLPSDGDLLLSNLERVGIKLSATNNCIIREVRNAPYLEHWNGKEANTDELNLLARMLEKMNGYMRQVFAAAMSHNQYDMLDAINLPYHLNRFVVVDNLLDKAEAGRRLVNANNISADAYSEEELVAWGEKLQQELEGIITPWGALYDRFPGEELEQYYSGLELPAVETEDVLSVVVTTPKEMCILSLPCADAYLQSTLLRLGLESWDGCSVCESFPKLDTLLEHVDVEEETIPDLNRMCRAIKQALPHGEKLLSAALEYTEARGAAEVSATVDAADCFELYEGVEDAEALGKHIFEKMYPDLAASWDFREVADLFPYDRFGEDYAQKVRYLSCGAVNYAGEPPIDKLLGRDSVVHDMGIMGQ